VTVGSYSDNHSTFNSASGSWLGSKVSKSWSGADRPLAAKVPKETYYIYREVWDPKKRSFVLRKIKIVKAGYRPKRTKSRDPHAYSMTYLRLEQGPVSWPDGRIFPDMWLLSPGSWSNSEGLLDSNDQIKLVSKIVDQLRGSDFNMSVFLGESHQTLSLLADSAIRIRKAVTHCRRLDLFGAARSIFEGTSRKPLPQHDWTKNRPFVPSAKNASSLWLELQYGWVPLLKDAEGAAQSLSHALNAPFLKRYRAKVRKEENVNQSRPFLGQGMVGSFLGSKKHERSIIAYIRENPPSLAAQLGLLDPELVAWELLPFSFVADWFIPIGQYMETRAQASRLTGTFITSDKREGAVLNPKISGPSGTFANGTKYRQILFSRSISSSLSVPMPNFKPLSKAASWQHCANAVALVTGLFSGRRSVS